MSAPHPERIGVAAVHPACIAEGQGVAARTAARFCRIMGYRLMNRGYGPVTIIADNDPALGAARHLVLGFRLADIRLAGIDAVTITGRVGRADLAGGSLYPPAAQVLPLIDGQLTDAALVIAADALLRDLGL